LGYQKPIINLRFLLVLFLFSSWTLVAQDRCGTVPYEKLIHGNNGLQKRQQFEQWIEEKVNEKNDRAVFRTNSTYVIPVVVHVVHNGEPVGTGTNISDAQILSQIEVLNRDFNRTNPDQVNTPAVFQSVAGSLDVQFVLAKQDPDGFATNGIVRVRGPKNGYTIGDAFELKSASYWPAENYLNIWVCNLTDLIGYAQFPEIALPGNDFASSNRLTDGVVIRSRAFGSDDFGSFNLQSPYTKGRTTTHEIGHFLGLRHIWGDDNGACSGTDYVSDTPNQANATQTCPVHPTASSCGPVIMFQNYMDYTDDACMNLFTAMQAARMTTVLENATRRASLLVSPGATEPVPVANDLSITAIGSPIEQECSTTFTPEITVRNVGNNNITSATITLSINGTLIESKSATLNLIPGAYENVSFAAITRASGPVYSIEFNITQVNGGADGRLTNNQQQRNFRTLVPGTLPDFVNFSVFPSNWTISNPDLRTTWTLTNANNGETGNRALFLDCYNYENASGEVDFFISPAYDFTGIETPSLSFDVAFAQYNTQSDKLRVYVVTNCGPVTNGTIVYDKRGSNLSTAPPTTSPFTPTGSSQWRREFISLAAFAGQPTVRIAFVGINDWGNNIYLDNVNVSGSSFEDLELVDIVSPGAVTCSPSVTPRVRVRNVGSQPVTSFKIDIRRGSTTVQTKIITGISISPGTDSTVTLDALTLAEAASYTFDLYDPNGLPDVDATNDVLVRRVVVNQSTARIPLRENFNDGSFGTSWTIVNEQGAASNWQTRNTNFGASLYVNNFGITDQTETWFVSPVLDVSQWQEASVRFQVSHRNRDGQSPQLILLASKDCGDTYQKLNFTLPTQINATSLWTPNTDQDWEEGYADLSAYAGEEQVRIAWVSTFNGTNSLYIDNIEFFTTANPDNIETELFDVYGYNSETPSGADLKIKFNLPELSTVNASIVNTAGQRLSYWTWADVLNQNYRLIEPALAPAGLYILRLEINGKIYQRKILLGF